MSECICKGNWRQIIKESEPLLENLFNDKDGAIHRFAGVMHCQDDYYYTMVSMAGEYKLYSCVGSLEMFGFEQVCS